MDEAYSITEKGYEEIWSWMILMGEEHDMDCVPAGLTLRSDECPMGHEVATLLAFVIVSPETARRLGVFK